MVEAPSPYRLTARFRLQPAQPGQSELIEAGRLFGAGRLAEAAALCRAILDGDLGAAEAWHLLGLTSSGRGDPDAALAPLERAAALAPASARVQYHLGNALLALERRAEAAARFRAALALDPGLEDAGNNLGNALRGMDREAEAAACYRDVLARQPDHAPALYNLGRSLTGLDLFGEAEAALRKAFGLVRDPAKRADIHAALATLLQRQARDEAALDELAAEARLRPPDAPEPQANAALALLRLGRYAEAWPLYERRFEVPGFLQGREAARPVPPPLDLKAVAGRRILLRGEQGRGDVIQFARYAPLLAERGAAVSLSVFPELVPLLRTLSGVATVTSFDDPDPPHDLDVSLLSLPLAFATGLASIPARVPYLSADPERRARWGGHLGPACGRRIGLCWTGSEHSRRRSSIALARLAPLLACPGMEFHALAKEIPAGDDALLAGWRIRDHRALLADYAETAALLSHMDLVISVDTSVAHLAGALGLPVWIMLRRSPDWRWMHGRTDSPWYPTARLFRSADLSGWGAVPAEMAQALAAWPAPPGPPILARDR